MSFTESQQDTEPPVKKQRIDSGEDQDVSMATEALHDGTSARVAPSEGEKSISSPPMQASYSFTITNGL